MNRRLDRPEAFVGRRSILWKAGADAGLMFVAFGYTTDTFQTQLHRVIRLEDGTVDVLFRFIRPVSGAHFECPPVEGGKLRLLH